ncbi:MAG: arylsulfatase [Candidatus Brocadiia bacterium]
MMNRRDFLATTGGAALGVALHRTPSARAQEKQPRPNVVLVMTDDQGTGDMSCHGNPHLQTPSIDRLATEGVELTQFLVCPVCAPTRASLMTGRYNYRTGVVDTYLGRAMMYSEEVTLAEMLGAAGYRTGIFGKWHLGDNYPLRPQDQGFAECLVHKGGGIGQPSDPPGNRYFDPVLQHNGSPQRVEGYCTDIFFDAAMDFIEANRQRPFFAYIATNAPHAPFQIAERYWKPYKQKGLDDRTAKVYGMVENIDEGLGRLLAKLEELGLDQNTVVIFLTDNGPNGQRYNCGLRGHKGSVYEGGIRTCFFVRWPARLKAGRKLDALAAHIDVAPTLLDACQVPKPPEVAFDGTSLLPLLLGRQAALPDRTIYVQWHRGDEPQPFRKAAARGPRYKLVHGNELYDLKADPGEKHNIAADHPDLVERMRAGYQAWFQDVSATRGYAPPRIHLGTPHENPTILTRQDWRGPRAGWGRGSLGYWEVEVARPGTYAVRLRFHRLGSEATAHFRLGEVERRKAVAKGASETTFEQVELAAGEGRLEAWVSPGEKRLGVRYVDVRRLE